jgi:hypothetical protein
MLQVRCCIAIILLRCGRFVFVSRLARIPPLRKNPEKPGIACDILMLLFR